MSPPKNATPYRRARPRSARGLARIRHGRMALPVSGWAPLTARKIPQEPAARPGRCAVLGSARYARLRSRNAGFVQTWDGERLPGYRGGAPYRLGHISPRDCQGVQETVGDSGPAPALARRGPHPRASEPRAGKRKTGMGKGRQSLAWGRCRYAQAAPGPTGSIHGGPQLHRFRGVAGLAGDGGPAWRRGGIPRHYSQSCSCQPRSPGPAATPAEAENHARQKTGTGLPAGRLWRIRESSRPKNRRVGSKSGDWCRVAFNRNENI